MSKAIKCCSCGRETESAYYQMKLTRKNGDYNGRYNICISCVHEMLNKEKKDKKG